LWGLSKRRNIMNTRRRRWKGNSKPLAQTLSGVGNIIKARGFRPEERTIGGEGVYLKKKDRKGNLASGANGS